MRFREKWFQFQMVQLKDAAAQGVSGAPASFQFQMVQLKGAIPLAQILVHTRFNSKWFN